MHIGSRLGWWTLAGMIIRPRATSERTNSGAEALAPGDVLHLFGDDALAGIVHLRADCIVLTFGYPLCAHDGSLMVAEDCGRARRQAARASTGTTRLPAYFFFFGFLTSFFGLLSLATEILPYIEIITAVRWDGPTSNAPAFLPLRLGPSAVPLFPSPLRPGPWAAPVEESGTARSPKFGGWRHASGSSGWRSWRSAKPRTWATCSGRRPFASISLRAELARSVESSQLRVVPSAAKGLESVWPSISTLLGSLPNSAASRVNSSAPASVGHGAARLEEHAGLGLQQFDAQTIRL